MCYVSDKSGKCYVHGNCSDNGIPCVHEGLAGKANSLVCNECNIENCKYEPNDVVKFEKRNEQKERENYLIAKLCDDFQQTLAMQVARGNMSSWDFFGFCITKAREKSWWNEFSEENLRVDYSDANPDNFSNLLYNFLKFKG